MLTVTEDLPQDAEPVALHEPADLAKLLGDDMILGCLPPSTRLIGVRHLHAAA